MKYTKETVDRLAKLQINELISKLKSQLLPLIFSSRVLIHICIYQNNSMLHACLLSKQEKVRVCGSEFSK